MDALIGSDEKMDASKVLNPSLIAAEQVQIVTNRFSNVEESLRDLGYGSWVSDGA